MEAFSVSNMLSVLSEFGMVGLVLFIYWFDTKQLRRQHESHRKEVAEILSRYAEDMAEVRKMYENNAELVRAYEAVAKDLRDVVIMNTEAFTRLDEGVRGNQFCPMVRLEKKAAGVQS